MDGPSTIGLYLLDRLWGRISASSVCLRWQHLALVVVGEDTMPQYDVRDSYGRKVGSVDYNPNRGELAEFLFLGVILGVWTLVVLWVRATVRYPLVMVPIHLLILGAIVLLVNLPAWNKPPMDVVPGNGSTHISWRNEYPSEEVFLARANSRSIDPNSKPSDISDEETVELPAGSSSYDWTLSEGGPGVPGQYWCYRLRYGIVGAWTPYTCY